MGVAIHGELGNPPITDATAVSEDVLNGKVFYNNAGKQTGNGNFLKENIMEVMIDKSMYQKGIDRYLFFSLLTYYAENGSMDYGNSYMACSRKQIYLDFDRILQIDVNEKSYPFVYSGSLKASNSNYAVRFMESVGESNAYFGNFTVIFDNKKNIYLDMDNKSIYESITFRFHYI